MHMAIGAVVNAVWDLRCRLDEQPLWRLLAAFSPQEIVDQVDFTYIDDALTPSEALDLLEAKMPGRANASPPWRPTAYRRTRRLQDGSATTTTRWPA